MSWHPQSRSDRRPPFQGPWALCTRTAQPSVLLLAAVMYTLCRVTDWAATDGATGVASTQRYHCGQYGAVCSGRELHNSEPEVMNSRTYRPAGTCVKL